MRTLGLLFLAGCATVPTLPSPDEARRRSRPLERETHLSRDLDRIAPLAVGGFVLLDNGEIWTLSVEEQRAHFAYFHAVTFDRRDALEPPRVWVSADGTLGSVAVRKGHHPEGGGQPHRPRGLRLARDLGARARGLAAPRRGLDACARALTPPRLQRGRDELRAGRARCTVRRTSCVPAATAATVTSESASLRGRGSSGRRPATRSGFFHARRKARSRRSVRRDSRERERVTLVAMMATTSAASPAPAATRTRRFSRISPRTSIAR